MIQGSLVADYKTQWCVRVRAKYFCCNIIKFYFARNPCKFEGKTLIGYSQKLENRNRNCSRRKMTPDFLNFMQGTIITIVCIKRTSFRMLRKVDEDSLRFSFLQVIARFRYLRVVRFWQHKVVMQPSGIHNWFRHLTL